MELNKSKKRNLTPEQRKDIEFLKLAADVAILEDMKLLKALAKR